MEVVEIIDYWPNPLPVGYRFIHLYPTGEFGRVARTRWVWRKRGWSSQNFWRNICGIRQYDFGENDLIYHQSFSLGLSLPSRSFIN